MTVCNTNVMLTTQTYFVLEFKEQTNILVFYNFLSESASPRNHHIRKYHERYLYNVNEDNNN